jgi:hydrogenase expression/formation protein HypC
MADRDLAKRAGRSGQVRATSIPPPSTAGTDDSADWPVTACTLDHDGCVVCSDAGIPLRVVAVQGDDALCEDAAGNPAQVAVELVAPIQVGDILLTHGGVAIGRIAGDSDEIRQ